MQLSLTAVAGWPAPNLVDPEVLSPGNTILIGVLHVLVTTLLVIRIYTRWKMSGGCRLDDFFIVLAYVPTTLFAAAGIHQELVLKIDRHIWDFPIENTVAAFKSSLGVGILFAAATTLTKLSMLALIHRIACAAKDRLTRWLVLAAISVVSVDGVVFIVVELTQCKPLSLYWTPSLKPQDCINGPAHLLAAGCINTVTDFIIVLLPIRVIMGLQMPRRQLLGIQALLAGGILATIAGAVRVVYTWAMHTAPDGDVTWRSHLVISLSAVELYIGIICASLPAMKPFFQHFIPRLLGSSSATEIKEPLHFKKTSRPASQDVESALGSSNLGRSRSSSLARSIPISMSPVSTAKSPRRPSFGKKNPTKGLKYIGRNSGPGFVWKPLISSPVIATPITPTFRIKPYSLPAPPSPARIASAVALSPFSGTTPRQVDGSRSPAATPPPNVNKPLPGLLQQRPPPTYYLPRRRSSLIERRHTSPPPAYQMHGRGARSMDQSSSQSSSLHSSSLFDLVAYEDGHISVHKAPKEGPR